MPDRRNMHRCDPPAAGAARAPGGSRRRSTRANGGANSVRSRRATRRTTEAGAIVVSDDAYRFGNADGPGRRRRQGTPRRRWPLCEWRRLPGVLVRGPTWAWTTGGSGWPLAGRDGSASISATTNCRTVSTTRRRRCFRRPSADFLVAAGRLGRCADHGRYDRARFVPASRSQIGSDRQKTQRRWPLDAGPGSGCHADCQPREPRTGSELPPAPPSRSRASCPIISTTGRTRSTSVSQYVQRAALTVARMVRLLLRQRRGTR